MASPAPSTPPRRIESLADRADLFVFGIFAASLVCYTLSRQSYVANFTHSKAPFLHTLDVYVPFAIVGGYLVMVHLLGPLLRRGSSKVAPAAAGTAPAAPVKKSECTRFVDFLLQLWNLFLCVLSLCMLIGLVGPFSMHVAENGVKEAICDSKKLRWKGDIMFWIYIFVISKYAELIDTVFLVFRGKPVSFLHWYHHTTVLLYCWFTIIWRLESGFFFAAMNCFVHTFMYWYYYRRACGVHLTYDKVITVLQITQMVLGLIVSSLWTYWHLQDPKKCSVKNPQIVIGATFTMYGSYFVLFALFFCRRYKKGADDAKQD